MMKVIYVADDCKQFDMEEKKFDEQVKDCIKQVCESGKYDVNFDEFDIDITFDTKLHNIKGTYIYLENEWDLTYKTTLTEKNGKFHHSIYSAVDPKYIAAYVVLGYKETKKKYEEKQQKEKEEKDKELNKKLFRRLFSK